MVSYTKYGKKRPFTRRATRRAKTGYRYKSKKKYNRPSRTIIKAPSGIPDTLFCTLNYTTKLGVTTAFQTKFYGMNTPRLPDQNVAGDTTQPVYFDNYTGIYDKYICYGSSINVTFVNTSTGLVEQMMLCPTDTTSFAAGAQDFRQSPKARYKLVGILGSGANVKRIYMKMMTKKILGLKYLDPSDAQNNGTASVDPTRKTYWCLGFDTIREDATAASGTFFISIKYFIKFFDRKYVTDS